MQQELYNGGAAAQASRRSAQIVTTSPAVPCAASTVSDENHAATAFAAGMDVGHGSPLDYLRSHPQASAGFDAGDWEFAGAMRWKDLEAEEKGRRSAEWRAAREVESAAVPDPTWPGTPDSPEREEAVVPEWARDTDPDQWTAGPFLLQVRIKPNRLDGMTHEVVSDTMRPPVPAEERKVSELVHTATAVHDPDHQSMQSPHCIACEDRASAHRERQMGIEHVEVSDPEVLDYLRAAVRTTVEGRARRDAREILRREAEVEREAERLRVRHDAAEKVRREKSGPARPFDAGTVSEILARPEEPAMRIAGLLPWSASMLLSAQRKTGKTTMVLNLARALLLGQPLLGRFDVQHVAGTIALLNFEVGAAQIGRWAADHGVPGDRLFVVNLRGRRNPLSNPEDRASLAGAAQPQR